jgi:hypothetical protein
MAPGSLCGKREKQEHSISKYSIITGSALPGGCFVGDSANKTTRKELFLLFLILVSFSASLVLSFDGRSFCISYGRQDQVSQKAWLIDL